MQAIAPVTTAQLLKADQTALLKFEIFKDGTWVNLANLPVEKLTDGGLESWINGDDLTYWTEFHVNGGVVVNREATIVHGGSFSCRLHTIDQGDYCGFYQDFSLTPGNNCKVSVWYQRAAHESSDLRLYVFNVEANLYLQPDGSWGTEDPVLELTESAIWKLFELEFTAHPDYTDYRIRFYKGHGAGGPISYYIDDVSVEEYRNLDLGLVLGGNYMESASLSLGGAGKTPNPVAGSWDASLSNENGIFHPYHPASNFIDYLKSGRKVRVSIGGRYGGVDYFWQRLIGYMDVPNFSSPDYKVNISGGDYMKLLQDMKFRSLDNYWGGSEIFNSISSDGKLGSELYNEVDAMDINNEADNVTNWPVTGAATFESAEDDGGGSVYVGKLISTDSDAYIKNSDVGTVETGKKYRVTFKYKRVTGSAKLRVSIWQQYNGESEHQLNFIGGLDSLSYDTATFYFTAHVSGPIIMKVAIWEIISGTHQFRIDQISIWEYIPYEERYYELPEASRGPYYVTLDKGEGAGPEPVSQGETDEGWYYEEDAEAGPDPPAHPAKIVFFDINKVVPNGEDNLKIYYFTVQSPENVVADLLVKCGLYADQEAALAAMEYDATDITIDKVWFKPGGTGLNAMALLCERCDYRFHFKYNGIPVFKPKAVPGETSFTFTDPKHISSVNTYQDRNEIKNRIVITGMKQASPVNKEETMPPELKGTAYDQTSIDLYKERTKTIKNHLFQDQDSIDDMCDSLLAEYKDPKWYADVEVLINPVPLEMGDEMVWKERLSPVLNITQTGMIRDIKIDTFNTTYVCEL